MTAPLRDAIRRSRGLPVQATPVSWADYFKQTLDEAIATALKNIHAEMSSELEAFVLRVFADKFDTLKGDPGDTPTVDMEELARAAAALVAVPTPAEIAAHVNVPEIKPVNEARIAKRAAALVAVPEIDLEAALERLKEELRAEKEPTEEPEDRPLAITDIAGLEIYLKNLQRSIREATREKSGGGGMGNPTHESFVVTAATTQFVTSKRVAANGFAIWVYYNGQELFRGRHYTAPTDQRTFPLLFTPDNPTPGQNNRIDVLYIRT